MFTTRTVRLSALIVLAAFMHSWAQSNTSPTSATTSENLQQPNLPNHGFVWIGDGIQLIQVKHSTAVTNHHSGRNFVQGQLAPFVFKPKFTIELNGAHSATRLDNPNAVIYVRSMVGDAKAADEEFGSEAVESWSLVRLQGQSDRRVISDFTFNRAGLHGQRSEEIIDVKSSTQDGWTKLEPATTLKPGEYALVMLPKDQSEWNHTVFDFGIDSSTNKEATTAVTAAK